VFIDNGKGYKKIIICFVLFYLAAYKAFLEALNSQEEEKVLTVGKDFVKAFAKKSTCTSSKDLDNEDFYILVINLLKKDDVNLVELGCDALKCIFNKDPNKVLHSEGVDIVINTLKSHNANVSVAYKLFYMIWSLLLSDEIRNSFTHTDILNLIQSAFNIHSQISNIVQICCACLQRLSKDPVCKSQIVNDGLFANVCAVAGSEFSKTDVSVAQSSIGAIWNLMYIKGTEESGGKENKDIGKIFVKSGGVSALNNALAIWGDKDLIVAKNSCGALWFASTHDAVQNEISRLETFLCTPQPVAASVGDDVTEVINVPELLEKPPGSAEGEVNVVTLPSVSVEKEKDISETHSTPTTIVAKDEKQEGDAKEDITPDVVNFLIEGLAKTVRRYGIEDANVSRNACNALDWLLNVGMLMMFLCLLVSFVVAGIWCYLFIYIYFFFQPSHFNMLCFYIYFLTDSLFIPIIRSNLVPFIFSLLSSSLPNNTSISLPASSCLSKVFGRFGFLSHFNDGLGVSAMRYPDWWDVLLYLNPQRELEHPTIVSSFTSSLLYEFVSSIVVYKKNSTSSEQGSR
jgi:hypothetical protein